MCEKKLKSIPTQTIIKELFDRGLITNAKSNGVILSELDKIETLNIILTKGFPVGDMECRECRNNLSPDFFSYYLSRVDQNGYLMRSNALCNICSLKSNKQRKNVLDNAKIPLKPKRGDECSNCNRPWNGNWHRHHEGDKFISWMCGHCNMSFSDQRNKN
jgi:hypothetical protein